MSACLSDWSDDDDVGGFVRRASLHSDNAESNEDMGYGMFDDDEFEEELEELEEELEEEGEKEESAEDNEPAPPKEYILSPEQFQDVLDAQKVCDHCTVCARARAHVCVCVCLY